jgi:Zn-dependent protease
MDSGTLARAAALIVPLVVAIVFHEVAHGWVARACGDPTAADQKRLTLNPLAHVDPVGTVVLPLTLALASLPVFGWAKPVPVRPDRMRRPRRDMMLVALAGPGMNLLLATLAAVALGVLAGASGGRMELGAGGFVFQNLFNFLLVNVFLALFNLLPLPPFDGGHVVAGLLPPRAAAHWYRFGRFGILLALGLLVILPALVPGASLVQRVVVPPADVVVRAFLRFAGLFA